MATLFLDTETEPIRPGHIPRLVAVGWALKDTKLQPIQVAHVNDPQFEEFRKLFLNPNGTIIVGHNLAFDLVVLNNHFGFTARSTLYSGFAQRFYVCTMLYDGLLRLASTDCQGEPILRSLEAVAGASKFGADEARRIQLSYRRDRPLTPEQVAYLRRDVELLISAYTRLQEINRRDLGTLFKSKTLHEHTRAAVALQYLSLNGLPVDLDELDRIEARLKREMASAAKRLQKVGWFLPARQGPRGGRYKARIDEKRLRADLERFAEAHGLQLERTATGRIAIGKDTLQWLQQVAGKVPEIEAYLQYKGAEKLLRSHVQRWREYRDPETGRVHPEYWPLLHTGRTASSRPNLQNIPKHGDKVWIRSCFVAPPGTELVEFDYKQLELACLAQLVPGKLREMIRAGQDVHRYVGSIFYGVPGEQITKEERFLMKCANFGFPAGMGPRTFVKHCLNHGLVISLNDAKRLREAWLQAFPEMRQYLQDEVVPQLTHNIDVLQIFTRLRFRKPVHPQLVAQAWARVESAIRAQSGVPAEVLDDLVKRRPTTRLLRWAAQRRVIIGSKDECWLSRFPVDYTISKNAPFQGLAARLTKRALTWLFEQDHEVLAYIHDSYLVAVPKNDFCIKVKQIKRTLFHTACGLLPDVYDENTPMERVVEMERLGLNFAQKEK